MPLGYQNRFTYGERMRSSGTNSSGVNWYSTGRPLIGYEALFTYRSGKKSKLLSQQANSYNSLVKSGSLSDQMRRRNEFLKMQINDILEPTTGSTGAFSCTGDRGHPFATFKMSSSNPYATYRNDPIGVQDNTTDVSLVGHLPYPDLADPLGFAFTDRFFSGTRHTYFSWPSTGGFLVPSAPPLAQQVVSNAVKTSVASGMIAGANPWRPKANLLQTILELLSGDIPTVTKNLRKYLYNLQDLKKSSGSDWLNVQFGWVPLLDDIRATTEVLLKLHMLLYGGSDSYRRQRGGDLGTWSRFISPNASERGINFSGPLSTSRNSPWWKDTGSAGVAPPSPGFIPGGHGMWSRALELKADFRFSAKYHRGASPNSKERGFIERGTEMLGLEMTPSVLWELTPWTWLLDWASNLGSVAENLSRLDWSNVLLDYAYLTFVVKTTGSVSWQGPTQLSSTAYLSHSFISQYYKAEEKIREQASPYGFSVSWTGLNAYQLSILAALGMSRGR